MPTSTPRRGPDVVSDFWEYHAARLRLIHLREDCLTAKLNGDEDQATRMWEEFKGDRDLDFVRWYLLRT